MKIKPAIITIDQFENLTKILRIHAIKLIEAIEKYYFKKEENTMIERYYYGRDKKTHAPLVTICLLENDGAFARGISVCSVSDQPSKAKGRKLALERAAEAITLKSNNHPIHKEENKYIRSLAGRSNKAKRRSGMFLFRSEYNPILTGFEANLLVLAQKSEEQK